MTDEVLKETRRIKESLGMRFDLTLIASLIQPLKIKTNLEGPFYLPQNLKYELQRGFESLDRGEISPRSARQIAEDVLKQHLNQ
jgi:hypothetical protein